MRGRHRTARIGPATRAYLHRVGRRGRVLGVVAVVALVPVLATAGSVVPSIAAASLASGASEVTGNGAELAAQLPGEESDDSVTDVVSPADAPGAVVAGSCPAPPAGAQAAAPSDPCAVSEPPAAAAAAAAPGVDPAASPVSLVSSVGGGTVFDAGNIIADAVFYNSSSMTDDQIAAFLAAQGARCSGQWCLPNLRVDVVAQPADEFCAAVPGGVGLTAAAVIGMVSRACGVNPQVMLVTLEKESGLLDRSAPSASSYDAAWGWHCPDTGPGGSANCDPAYAGFVNQAYGMAKQWARYRVHPEQYNYRAGQTVNIMWNVAESGCGAAPVTISNTATASLYNYTPYQPNAAALASYPGVGDACSAYGNRNFFFLFNRYFGSTGGGNTGINVAAAATGLATPVAVPVPANAFVSGGLAGRTIMAPTPAVAAGLKAGFAALGRPYVWGGGGSGAGPNNGCARGGGQFNSCGTEIGFDCSGLTAYVLGQAGFGIPGDSSGQRRSGIPVAWDRALPGDIVGYPGHVAVYLGITDGVRYILEASWVGTPVHIVPLTRTDADATVYRYWTAIPGFVDSSAAILGSTAAAPRAYVANLAPLPVPAGVPGTTQTQPAAAPTSNGSESDSPSSGSPAPSASGSGSPTATSSPATATSTTDGSSGPATTAPSGTTTSGTTTSGTTTSGTTTSGTTTSGTATPGTAATGTSTTAATGSTATTTRATGTTASSPAATTTGQTGTSTGQTTATSSQPATTLPTATTGVTTGPPTTATSPPATATPSTTAAPPATPVICPSATPELTPALTTPLTPTLPVPTVGSPATTAGTAKPAAGTTTTFAALIQSLIDGPCG